MTLTRSALATLACASAVVVLATGADAAQTTTRPAYGCFKVSALSAPILDKGSKKGTTIATAEKGSTLVKTKRFCGLRGYCSVRYHGTSGFVDKANVKVAPCPPSTSKPVN